METKRHCVCGKYATFTQSHNIVYKFLLFSCFKLKLISICRESNTVSADRKSCTHVSFLRLNIFKKEKCRKTITPPGMWLISLDLNLLRNFITMIAWPINRICVTCIVESVVILIFFNILMALGDL